MTGFSRTDPATEGPFPDPLALDREPPLTSKKTLPKEGLSRSAPGRTRTCGQVLRRHLLYPLSYGGRVVAVWPGAPCGWGVACRDKDRAPITLARLLHLRGTMWRFGEAER